jgi:CheY-like chemotaxis protein
LLAALARIPKLATGKEVLVVEDDAGMRGLLRRMLEAEDWTVAEAENGRQALDRLAQAQPSLIILDLLMPVMDGFEFIEELHQDERWRKIPVIVVSAKEVTQVDRARLDGHVTKILQKGAFTKERLLAEVREVVGRLIGK